jgi:hypothetical protein
VHQAPGMQHYLDSTMQTPSVLASTSHAVKILNRSTAAHTAMRH